LAVPLDTFLVWGGYQELRPQAIRQPQIQPKNQAKGCAENQEQTDAPKNQPGENDFSIYRAIPKPIRKVLKEKQNADAQCDEKSDGDD
jgi:hypothetical protein